MFEVRGQYMMPLERPYELQTLCHSIDELRKISFNSLDGDAKKL